MDIYLQINKLAIICLYQILQNLTFFDLKGSTRVAPEIDVKP